jgi:ThiF family
MSRRLIARSSDLMKLQDEGFDITTKGGTLIVRDVPYLDANGEVRRGTLTSALDLADDRTVNPVEAHVMHFAGEKPHRLDGTTIPAVIGEGLQETYGGVAVSLQLSTKPLGGVPYRDYHHKVTTYAEVLGAPARQVDPSTTARTHPIIVDEDEDSVFKYVDNASSRLGLEELSDRLAVGAVAIIGLGGTGSYLLDLLAKTPIGQIHLFDGDLFLQHNAFRAPGAPTNEILAARPHKVSYLAAIYSAMRRGIVEHPYRVDEATIDELRGMDFAFIAVDDGAARTAIATRLQEFGVGFIDVGLGVKEKAGVLTGLIRTTAVTAGHQHAERRLPGGGGGEDDYTRNIQIAELNALNAVLAVIKWKKLVGFYGDIEGEFHSLYALTSNHLINEDKA